MTDLSFPYGRSFSTALSFFESDGSTPKDCTGGVVEWWVNDAPADGINDSVEIAKRSYDSAEIATVDEAQGQYTLKVRAVDNELEPADYFHCAVLTLRGAVATSTGTVDVTAGSGTITGTGLVTDDIHDGDLLVISGGANDGQTVIVRHELDTAGNPTGNLVTAFTGWTDQSGASFTIYEADKPDVSGVSGKYTIEAC